MTCGYWLLAALFVILCAVYLPVLKWVIAEVQYRLELQRRLKRYGRREK